MNEKKSHQVNLSETEFELFESLKDKPELLEQLTSISKQFSQEVANGMDANEAECHVVKAVGEIGKSMLSSWAESTQDAAVQKAKQSADLIKQGKKNATGIAPSEKSNSKPKS